MTHKNQSQIWRVGIGVLITVHILRCKMMVTGSLYENVFRAYLVGELVMIT